MAVQAATTEAPAAEAETGIEDAADAEGLIGSEDSLFEEMIDGFAEPPESVEGDSGETEEAPPADAASDKTDEESGEVAASDDSPSDADSSDSSSASESEVPESAPAAKPEVEPEPSAVQSAESVEVQQQQAPQAEAAPQNPPEVAVTPTVTAEEAQERYQEQYNLALSQLAEGRYSIPSEMAETLEPETAQFMSKLAATVYMDAVSSTMQRVVGMLPQAVQGIQQTMQETDQHEQAFYNKWPGLKSHETDVLRYANSYRQANPTATPDQVIQDVGTMVSVALRIPIEGVSEPQSPEPAPVPPFQPATSAPPAAPVQRSSINQFESMAEEFLEDDART